MAALCQRVGVVGELSLMATIGKGGFAENQQLVSQVSKSPKWLRFNILRK